MKISLLPVLLLVSVNTIGYTVGGGDVELGISKDKVDYNLGLSANYELEKSGKDQSTFIYNKIQVGSNEGRSLVATAAHEYQYEQSFIRSEIVNGIKFYYPGLIWESRLSHGLEFVDENEDPNSDSDIDYQSPNENWSLTTGPSFTYDKSKWFSYRSKINASKNSSNDEENTEESISIGIGKNFNPITSSFMDASKICTQYGSKILEDQCREELTLSFHSNRQHAKYHFELGVSSVGDIKTNIYLLRFSHKINSYSDVDLEFKKGIENISTNNEIDSEIAQSFKSAIRIDKSLSYTYEWGRKRFELKARELESISDIITIKTLNAAVYYGYQLGSKLCYACKAGLSYEYLDYGVEEVKTIKSLLLTKNHSKRMSSSLGFRRTNIENELDAWSIDFLVSYKGSITKIGSR